MIDGLETLDDLEKLPVNEKTYRPLTEVRIKNVTIHANPIADKSGWINPTGKLQCKPTTTYCLLPNMDDGVCYQTSNTGRNNFTIKQLQMQQKTIPRDCVKENILFWDKFCIKFFCLCLYSIVLKPSILKKPWIMQSTK